MLKLNYEKSKIWFSSDLHICHKGICKGVSHWNDKSGCRNFNSLYAMDSTIIQGVNKYVGEYRPFNYENDIMPYMHKRLNFIEDMDHHVEKK